MIAVLIDPQQEKGYTCAVLSFLNSSDLIHWRGAIVDVRSPSEFTEGGVPGAQNIPLFTDEERRVVGTLYKKTSPQKAREEALRFVRIKLNTLVDQVLALRPTKPQVSQTLDSLFDLVARQLVVEEPEGESLGSVRFSIPESPLNSSLSTLPSDSTNCVLFYCWRGGARSKSMAYLASLLGVRAFVLNGGHKSFRAWVLSKLNQNPYSFQVTTIYGLTGSGKTELLQKWKAEGKPVIDLEALAHHRGSAFGQLGHEKRGRQVEFENALAWEMALLENQGAKEVFVEGESQRIGYCQIPNRFFEAMAQGTHLFIEKSLEDRVEHLMQNYVLSVDENLMRAEAERALYNIRKRLGSEKHAELLALLMAREYRTFTRELLVNYYDKMYARSR
ncbi:MAG: tRNA 2-selenouridine(34) synthase MnmH, partial [Oligoflexia bacterium]|nr:tRNA 2-selenouridine(34) synthase MnmH [Oligoflexia bacterium]